MLVSCAMMSVTFYTDKRVLVMAFLSKIKNMFSGTKPSTEPNNPCNDSSGADVLGALQQLFPEGEIKGDGLFFSGWDMTIFPVLIELKDGFAGVELTLSCPLLDRDLVEETAGIGKTAEQAVTAALFGFFTCMMTGFRHVLNDLSVQNGKCECKRETIAAQSAFAGKTHNWKIYVSNSLSMGDVRPEVNLLQLMGQLLPKILARLGNQKINYVKLFVAQESSNRIVTECRINNIASPELGAALEDFALNLSGDGYASQKMFIFLVQEKETYTPYRHTPAQIGRHVRAAIQIMEAMQIGETLKDFTDKLALETNDMHLAREIAFFLPELCAERVHPYIEFGETIQINANGQTHTVFKTQMDSYYYIWEALRGELNRARLERKERGFSSTFPEKAFNRFIALSASELAVNGIEKSDSPSTKKGGYHFHLCYNFEEAFASCQVSFRALH